MTSSREEGPAGATEAGANSTPHRLVGKELPFSGVPASTPFPFLFTPDTTACFTDTYFTDEQNGAPTGTRTAQGTCWRGRTGHHPQVSLPPYPPWALGKGRSGFKSRSFNYGKNIGNNNDRA